jgi:transcriptional antiterminator RfaH
MKMLNWYLVQLKPNGHRLAKMNLERQGFKTFLPLQNVTKRSAHKFVDRLVPLFPGYMFVELDTTQNARLIARWVWRALLVSVDHPRQFQVKS